MAIDIHEFRDGRMCTWHTEDWLTGLRLGAFEK